MDDCMHRALEIVKAQARVRVMTEAEMTSMVARLAAGIRTLAGAAAGVPVEAEEVPADGAPVISPKDAIREKSIICLESGKRFKVLTRKHLAKFGLTPDEYREKWGMKKGQPLICKGLQRERRKKMREMQLWEKRRLALAPAQA